MSGGGLGRGGGRLEEVVVGQRRWWWAASFAFVLQKKSIRIKENDVFYLTGEVVRLRHLACITRLMFGPCCVCSSKGGVVVVLRSWLSPGSCWAVLHLFERRRGGCGAGG